MDGSQYIPSGGGGSGGGGKSESSSAAASIVNQFGSVLGDLSPQTTLLFAMVLVGAFLIFALISRK